MGFSVAGTTADVLTVLGSDGSAVVQGAELRIYGKDASEPHSIEAYEDDDGYAAEYRDFHAAIAEGTPPRSTFGEAYADLTTLLEVLNGAAGERAA